jgi:hypothetical protein
MSEKFYELMQEPTERGRLMADEAEIAEKRKHDWRRSN